VKHARVKHAVVKHTRVRALATGLLALALLGYVIPTERVVHEIAARRASLPELRVEAELELAGSEGVELVRFELDPDRGARVLDAQEGRWLLLRGRIWTRADADIPPWIPPLEVLVVRDEVALAEWLREAGVDVGVNTLARCGEADCFVVGGPASPDQLWVDKDLFEVRRRRTGRGRVAEFEDYRDWGGVRFPERILLADPLGKIATLRVVRVTRAPELAKEDFSPSWLD
jgi:hypothetical protein